MATAMTGADLYEMTTNLLDGITLDTTLFYQLLTIVQVRIESAREWMYLRKQDTTGTVLQSNTFKNALSMPSNFLFWQSDCPITLVNPNNTNDFLDSFNEVPVSKLVSYQFQSYKYAVDYPNSILYIAGTVDKTYTIYKNYIYKPDDVTETTSWAFPAQFHGLLAYAVAALQKGGIDFDDQNARMAGDNAATVQSIYQAMIDWDSRLQEQSLEGVDRGYDGTRPWITSHISFND